MSHTSLVRRRALQAVHLVLCSPWIDAAMYAAALGGPQSDLNTVSAYLALPNQERPQLSLYFDRTWYLYTNPDVAALETDALFHFLAYGMTDLRSPHPLIDLRYIDRQDSTYFAGMPTVEALLELLDFGLMDPSPYFSTAHYDTLIAADRSFDGAMLRHFLSTGLARNQRPHPLLDIFWYAGHYPDVPRDPYAALRHFAMIGDIEGRCSSTQFDGMRYFKRYPDIREAGVSALKHFIEYGKAEGRMAVEEPLALARKVEGTVPVAPRRAYFGIEPPQVRADYDAFRERVSTARQAAIERFEPAPVPIIALDLDNSQPKQIEKAIASLRFKLPIQPTVSVLIPVYNELHYTVECLMSLQKHAFDSEIEIIVADDASTDEAVKLLINVSNLVVVRQEANVGFLKNCNAAFHRARGKYVLLLNNDAQLLGPAVHTLAACLDADSTIAAVGPKIIYPNGRLQESGCSLDANGNSQMIGLFRDPDEPAWNYARDVHYISGAALMIRKELVVDKLFDEDFAPAYCEDAELCLRLQAAGGRIRYCPDAVVAHHLSVSTGRAPAVRRLQLVSCNQAKLAAKWKDKLATMNRVRTICFYLPQFHPTAENDAWWGRGFTEWTNVTRAEPSYSGHYQPHLAADLGYYDLRLTEMFAEQAKLAARYGIAGFCVYYYNFDGRRVLHEAFEKLVRDPSLPFPFCICWANENWTRHWDGGDRAILLGQSYSTEGLESVVADAIRYARDPRYLKVNGKPLFLLYRPSLLPDATAFAALCRQRFREAGFNDVHLVYVESMELTNAALRPAEIGFDACVEFPPQGSAVQSKSDIELLKPGWAGSRYDYAETAQAFINRPLAGYARYPAVFPSWDNTPRQPLKGTSFDGISPTLFQAYVEAKLEEVQMTLVGDERLLFVNSWNEWAEGAHLEPDQALGHRWLEALRDGLEKRGCI